MQRPNLVQSEVIVPTIPFNNHYCSTMNQQDYELIVTPIKNQNMEQNQEQILSEAVSIFGYCRKNSAFEPFDPIKQKTTSMKFSDSEENQFEKQQIYKSRYTSKINHNIQKQKRQKYRLETKNLNRFFRSKINQMLRDISQNSLQPDDVKKANEIINELNRSNKIMFSQMREILKDQWFQNRLQKCRCILMRYVHCGKMGMQSKLIMLKYFDKILQAIKNPYDFTCWK